MSIEQKAKAYDEAISMAKKWYDTITNKGYRRIFEEIFPELKSEDERIRKALIEGFQQYDEEECWRDIEYLKIKDIIAWLEKQGKYKQTIIIPKFTIGDWIITKANNIYQVVAVIDTQYQLKYGDNYTTQYCEDIDRCARLYDVAKDAKNGDVLTYRDGQWIFIYKEKSDDNSFFYHALYSTTLQDLTINDAGFTLLNRAITPATKEQRNLLFQKIKEAGYEWNAKKKELNEIKQNLTDIIPEDFEKYVEELLNLSDGERHGRPAKVKEVCLKLLELAKIAQKPTEWSEEDKKMLST